MALNDVISIGITKNIVLGSLAYNWIIIAFILYGCQMIIFYNGIYVVL
jgi:hypothetical protein